MTACSALVVEESYRGRSNRECWRERRLCGGVVIVKFFIKKKGDWVGVIDGFKSMRMCNNYSIMI